MRMKSIEYHHASELRIITLKIQLHALAEVRCSMGKITPRQNLSEFNSLIMLESLS